MTDVDSFKAGMRQLTAGVCLVTTQTADGSRSGLTATAVCSVSAEPPILLVCINRENNNYAAIRNAGRFAVNVLAAEDQDLSNRFASTLSGDERFHHGDWRTSASGVPFLSNALASFACTLMEVKDMGSHGVFFGQVNAVQVRPGDAPPLLYGDGSYGTLKFL